MKRFPLVAMLLLLCAAMPLAQANTMDFTLSAEEVEDLPEAAAEVYRAGVLHMDHVRYEYAFESYVKAAALAPEHVPVRFLVGKMGEYMGRKDTGDKAIAYFEAAKKAYEEIAALGRDAVGRYDMRRTDRQVEKLDKLIAQQPERDAKRQKIGEEILKAHLEDIGYKMKKK